MKPKLGKHTVVTVSADNLPSLDLAVTTFSESGGKAPQQIQTLGKMNAKYIFDTTRNLSGQMTIVDDAANLGAFVDWYRTYILGQGIDDAYPNISIKVVDYFDNGAKRERNYYDCGFAEDNFSREPETPKSPTFNWYANDDDNTIGQG
jgi:hypothetical protein